MERQESITGLSKNNNVTYIIIAIILFHIVGLFGLSYSACRPLFLRAVPWHLLLMFFLVIINHQRFNFRFFVFIILICLLGFLAELIGVRTNRLFGHYNYGQVLGLKLWDVPLIMCVNWFILIYAVGTTCFNLNLKSRLIRIITGSLTLVLLDVLIEPVAMRFDYWHWQNNSIPVVNYICWFLLSFLMLYLFEWFQFKKQNWVGAVLLLCQFVFFAASNF